MTQVQPNPPVPASVKAVRWVKDVAVVEVHGDVDLSRSNDFQHALLTVLDQRPARMVIHLVAVPYMDSSGVASLVKLLGKARKSGTVIVLAELSGRVRSIFEITKLDTVFTIRPTVEEAMS